MNETVVTVVGNIASEVSGKRVGAEANLLVGFRVASSQRRWDKANECWTDGDRFSAWVSCWRKLGEGVVTSLVKGDPVVVTGRLSVREYETNGERRYSTEIAATAVGPDLGRSSAAVTRRRQPAPDGQSDGSGSETTGRVLAELSSMALPAPTDAEADRTAAVAFDAAPEMSSDATSDASDAAAEMSADEEPALAASA